LSVPSSVSVLADCTEVTATVLAESMLLAVLFENVGTNPQDQSPTVDQLPVVASDQLHVWAAAGAPQSAKAAPETIANATATRE
jgi:hypothetical protein